jgi:uncharacterized SAM-binding protein YcdF (DUF218 family)
VAYTGFMENKEREAVDTLWEYLQLHEQVGPADCLIVLGSRDDRVALYAAELISHYNYETVVVTGGAAHHNDLLKTTWSETTEAEHFSAVMTQQGIGTPVILETEASNTGENATLSHALLERHGFSPASIVVVTKPYMERRAKATFDVQWPGSLSRLVVTSPPTRFSDYVNDQQPVDTVINIMGGDMQRIMEYPARGLQSEQAVPVEIKAAYDYLVAAGYTKHMLHTM